MEYLKTLNFSHDFWLVILPLILMVIDIITGYYNAWKKNQISSSKMRDGIGKKIAELCYIVIGICFSLAFNVKPVAFFVSIYIIYMEIMSILENCAKLGLSIPSFINEKLNNEKNDKNE